MTKRDNLQSQKWVVGAQLSTSHSSAQDLTVERVLTTIAGATKAVDLQILIVGAREIPDLLRAVTDLRARPVAQVYYWGNLLSDVPGMDLDELIVNWRGEKSRGWGGWAKEKADVDESFRFICPNNPVARQRTLDHLGRMLDSYPFDGIFLDKMRFPSPANGSDEMISCFCSHCRRLATEVGVDLDAVASLFDRQEFANDLAWHSPRRIDAPAWSYSLIDDRSLLARFMRFRCDSITRLVAEVRAEMHRRGRKLALDLFSPSLAPLVGQDYSALAKLAAWVKPMVYRKALGPSSLRLEVPALIDNLAALTGAATTDIDRWCADHLEGFDASSLQMIRATAVPFPIVMREIAGAVNQMTNVPVYFGIEVVRHAGIIDTNSADIVGALNAGREAQAAGTIISWDLMHAPVDGIRTLAAELYG
jgi:hypothetical protein